METSTSTSKINLIDLIKNISDDEFIQLNCLKDLIIKIQSELKSLKSRTTEKRAFDLIKSGYNVFLTGGAGTGKSTQINKIIDYFDKQDKNFYVCASTGVASTLIKNGITLHSYIGLGTLEYDYKSYIKWFYKDVEKTIIKSKFHQSLIKKYKNTDVLIIDEISMVSANTLVILNKLLRHFRGVSKPFGGVQLIVSGDFLQLAPVPENDEVNYCFRTKTWRSTNFKVINLTVIHRQQNKKFIEALHQIRIGKYTEDVKTYISKLNNKSEDTVHIFATNEEVNKLNDKKLIKIEGECKTYDLSIKCFNLTKQQTKNREASTRESINYNNPLKLKIGAQVIFTRNGYRAHTTNGTLGIVIGMRTKGKTDPTLYPYVQIVKVDGTVKKILCNPKKYQVILEKSWLNGKFIKESWIEYSYIPLRLAWGLTINKTQGMTLPHATLHFENSFTSGQLYTALSRAMSPEGINVIGDIKYYEPDKSCLEFYENLE